jgi:phosphatidylglycerol:prolipoprotein diacylglycerol transferase
MWPTLYTHQTEFGEIPLNTYGLAMVIAFLAAALVAHRRLGRVGIDPDVMGGMVGVCIFGGVMGARLLHFLMAEGRAEFFANPLVFFDFSKGGLAFYGGFILAGLFGVLYGFWQRLHIWKFADVTVPTVMVGLAIGRLGCFFAGCCHGVEAVVPAGAEPFLAFHAERGGGAFFALTGPPFLGVMTDHGVGLNGAVVYPTQIFETTAAFAIFGVASWFWYRRAFDGQVTAVVLLLYALWRPLNESLRGDSIRGTDWWGLTTSQLISIPVFLFGLVILAARARRGVDPETPFVGMGGDDAFIPPEDLGSAPKL